MNTYLNASNGAAAAQLRRGRPCKSFCGKDSWRCFQSGQDSGRQRLTCDRSLRPNMLCPSSRCLLRAAPGIFPSPNRLWQPCKTKLDNNLAIMPQCLAHVYRDQRWLSRVQPPNLPPFAHVAGHTPRT